jgi:DMSO/TMAO reductase YedYZ molybdopterin-dependent catalytic subunit
MSEDRPFSRRDLLRLGLTAGAASLATACGWQGGPLMPALQAASRVNDWVGEKILLSRHRLAPQYQLTDPSGWALEVGGQVRKPVRLTVEMIQALPKVRYTVKHHCVEGWSAVATWTGAPLASVVAMVEPTPEAKYLRFDSFDRGYFNGWDLESAMHPQTILAYAFNDRPLRADHGAPLRLYSPVKLGYKLTKYLTKMTFTAERPGGYWEDQGYPWLGGV